MNFHFAHPYYFLLLFTIPLYMVIEWFMKKPSTIVYSSLSVVNKSQPRFARSYRAIPFLIRVVVFILLIIGLGRPQVRNVEREHETKGVDIVIALDISGSMKAEDFQPANRLEVAKEEAKKFIQGRHTDRMGLVIFSQQSITQCPLTVDYDVLIRLMNEVHIGMIKDGTAIGLAIANAINRLRDSDAKGKVIILLTDGENNAGQIDPLTAATMARQFGIKIYTIGVGKGGVVPYPVDDPVFGRRYTNVEVTIDEAMLTQIADLTGGLYFRARDKASLEEIYHKIDQLEKTEIKVKEYLSIYELYPYVVYPALVLLLFEQWLSYTLFLKIP